MLLGRSINVTASLNRERSQLQFGAHPSAALQRDWDRLGADAFRFEVLDILTPHDPATVADAGVAATLQADLAVLETLWRERLTGAGLAEYRPGRGEPWGAPPAGPEGSATT